MTRARDAFWRAGYQATSLDQISAVTGLKRPSLYGAFGDKRAMFLAALRTYRLTNLARARQLMSASPTLRQALAGVYAAAIDIYAPNSQGCLILNTAPSEAETDPDVRDELAAVTRDLDEVFAARVAAALVAGEIEPATDPQARGRQATAELHSLSLRARGGARRAELETLAASAVDWLVR